MTSVEQAEASVSPWVYVGVFVALIALTGLTVAAAFVDLGRMNVVVAFAIAGVKATLVTLFFMHVLYARPLTWVAVSAGLIWLAVLLLLTLNDYTTRGWLSTPAK
jgi:cytochrome c oxidase subunit 4